MPTPPLTDPQRELAADYFRFALKVATRTSGAARDGLLPDYLYDAAVSALIEAVSKYDASRGLKVPTWVGWIVVRRVRTRMGTAHASAFTFVGTLADRYVDLALNRRQFGHRRDAHEEEDRRYAPEDLRPEPPDGDAIEAMLGGPERHRDILRGIYRDGLTQREVAARDGLSKSRLCVLHEEAIGYARDHIEARNEHAHTP